MHAIVLAAGFGARMGSPLDRTPTCLLPMGSGGCILDRVVTSLWTPSITCIHIVYNSTTKEWRKGTKLIRASWRELFHRWFRDLRWTPESGKNQTFPILRLVDNGIWDPENAGGAVGDLAFVLGRMNHACQYPVLVACANEIYPDPCLQDLQGDGTTSAVTVRSVHELHRSIQKHAVLSAATVESGVVGRVVAGDHPDAAKLLWRVCSPMYLTGDDCRFVFDWVRLMRRAGIRPDSLCDLVDAMVEDGRAVRAVQAGDRYWIANNAALYRELADADHGRFLQRNASKLARASRATSECAKR